MGELKQKVTVNVKYGDHTATLFVYPHHYDSVKTFMSELNEQIQSTMEYIYREMKKAN